MNEIPQPHRDDAREEPRKRLPGAPAVEPVTPAAEAKGLGGARI